MNRAHFKRAIETTGNIFNKTKGQPVYLSPLLSAQKGLSQTQQFGSNSSAVLPRPLKFRHLPSR